MENRADIQQNIIYHLEDTVIMCGAYNSDTLSDLIDPVHKMHNSTTIREKKFAGVLHEWLRDELVRSNNEYNYTIDSLLFLTMVKEKHVQVYEWFILELRSNYKVLRILSKVYLPISLLPPLKLEAILKEVRQAFTKTNKDYDLVMNRLYLYYGMKLIMVGNASQKNLIIQFPVFVQSYT